MKIILLLIILALAYSFKNVLRASGRIDCFANYKNCTSKYEKDFCVKLFSDCVKNIH